MVFSYLFRYSWFNRCPVQYIQFDLGAITHPTNSYCFLCVCVPEVLSRIAQTTAASTRLKPVWIDKSSSLSSKIRLMRSLVTSIFLYDCESWTLTAELQRRIQAMELRCYCTILHISYKDHVTNEEVRAKIQQAVGPHEDLLTIVKRRKLQWYGYVWPKTSCNAQ